MTKTEWESGVGVRGFICGDKHKLLVVLHGTESDHPAVQQFYSFCRDRYDEVKVVRQEDLPVKSPILLMSTHDVLHVGPRSVLRDLPVMFTLWPQV